MSDSTQVDQRYAALLSKVPRRTNECWLGDVHDENGVYVCGHKFLLHLEGTALALWRAIDSQHSAGDLADEMSRSYPNTPPERITQDVVEFLLGLEALGLAAWRTRALFEDIRLDD